MASDLSNLVRRLESAVARLEAQTGATSTVAELRRQVEGVRRGGDLAALTRAVAELETSTQAESGPGDARVQAFASSVSSGPAFSRFLSLSSELGGEVAQQAQMARAAFEAQYAFLALTIKARPPKSSSELTALLKDTSDNISQAQAFREKNRRSQFFNHLSAVSESIPALGWVTVSPAPAPFVRDMNEAGQFYTNRVLKEFKEKDKRHADWVKAWLETLANLQAFVKEHYTTGLLWNAKGGDPMTLAKSGSGAGAGGPPPPPPPPPADFMADVAAEAAAGSGDKQARSALFAELNRGEDVTKGLKKVTADMQTHKNPSLRSAPGKATAAAPKGASSSKPGAAATANKPPKLALEGRKWIVEYQNNENALELPSVSTNQSVYVYRCQNSTLKISGKCNNIVVDSCKKVAVVFDNVVSSCEFINCQSVQMQVMGVVPTISVDKTDGCQMYLSKDALDVAIISSKSSEMNVVIPKGDDFVEQPVPEQFKTTVNGGKLNTTVSESA